MYEYFKVSSDILVDALELLFNYILDTGDFPSFWTRCIIIPIHKKGNTSDPNNYRGISLVSCFSKLFNTILNKRLKEWADINDKVTYAQFGVKVNYSTVGAIFILNRFIQEKIRTKGKLFCCFVDFRKAYDLINRNCLWYKLIKDGIDGKMFNPGIVPCKPYIFMKLTCLAFQKKIFGCQDTYCHAFDLFYSERP